MSCPCAEPLALRLGQDLGDVAFELGVAQVAELDRHQVAVHAQHRRHADGEMDVGAALREAELQECVDACHGGLPDLRGDFFERRAQLVHGLVALGLVDRHGLA